MQINSQTIISMIQVFQAKTRHWYRILLLKKREGHFVGYVESWSRKTLGMGFSSTSESAGSRWFPKQNVFFTKKSDWKKKTPSLTLNTQRFRYFLFEILRSHYTWCSCLTTKTGPKIRHSRKSPPVSPMNAFFMRGCSRGGNAQPTLNHPSWKIIAKDHISKFHVRKYVNVQGPIE